MTTPSLREDTMLIKRFAHPLGAAVCVLALALLAMPALAQNAKGRTITGTVLDVDAKPVAHATVTVAGGGPSTTTTDDGSFKLAGVATTNVVLEVTADGFTAKQVPVLGAATALQLSVVVDASRAPVAGATVRVHGTAIQTVTGADGSFTLPGVAVTEVALDIEAA